MKEQRTQFDEFGRVVAKLAGGTLLFIGIFGGLAAFEIGVKSTGPMLMGARSGAVMLLCGEVSIVLGVLLLWKSGAFD